MIKYSRKRFQECLRATKEIAKNSRLPATVRLRAVELTYLLYGGELPGGPNKRDKRSIKDLVQERSLEKQIRTTVDEQTKPKTEEQEQEEKVSAALAEFLKTTPKATEIHPPKTAPTVQASTQKEEHEQQLWLHQMATIGDLGATREDRVAAIRTIQSQLPAGHPLRLRDAYDLLREVKDASDTRLFRDRSGAGYFKANVNRPPIELEDIF